MDALKTGRKPYVFEPIKARKDFAFTTHTLSAEALLYLCQLIYNHRPEAHTLGIRGYEYFPGRSITEKARENLKAAFDFLINFLKNS